MFWVVCLVLVVAGTSKVSAPQLVAPTFAALLSGRSGKEPAGRSGDGSSGVWVARTLGAVELLVGIVALTVGGVAAAVAVAVTYVVFAGVVVMARRRGLASCGCFGLRSAPPSWVHVAVNAVSSAIAVGAAVAADGPVPVADGLEDLGGLPAVVVGELVVVATALVVVLDTTVADAVESARSSKARGRARMSTGDLEGDHGSSNDRGRTVTR